MAADVCSDISNLVSPRISFSHDLNQSDIVPVECRHRRSDALLLDSTPDFDFDFCIAQEISLSSADELFANGKILPTQIKKPTKTNKTHQPHQIEDSKKKRLKEFLYDKEEEEEEEEKPSSKSFWQFRRSSSLNCDTSRSKGLIRSLQSLSRSHSTGSALTKKQTVPTKVNHQKQQSQKQPSFTRSNSCVAPSNSYYAYNSSKKPPLKNCRSYSNGNGVRMNHVLNIPPAYISKGTVSLFGFGSLFCNGKSKKKKNR